MGHATCQDCKHEWSTRKSVNRLQDPKCSECSSRNVELEADEDEAVDTTDDTLREALDPLSVDNPRYIVQFFDAREDDAERLRDLMVEAGADTERATRAAEWYFRQVDREINVPERSGQQGGGTATVADAPDPDEVAERTAQEVERRIKTDETADGWEDNTPSAVAEARDKALLSAAEKVENAGDKLERVGDALLDLLIDAAREDPEIRQALIDAVGLKTLVTAAAERDSKLLEKLTIETDDDETPTPTDGPGAARMTGGESADSAGNDNQPTPDERVTQARKRAEEQTQSDDSDDSGDEGAENADDDSSEEVLEDFKTLAEEDDQ